MMKTLKNLIHYHFDLYFKSKQYILPFVALAALIVSIYSVKPLKILDSVSASCTFLFLVTLWIGFVYWNLKDEKTEQILILRLKSQRFYYGGDGAFLGILGFLIGVAILLLPLGLNLLNGNTLFEPKPGIMDFVWAGILQGAAGFLGTAVGAFFHPRAVNGKQWSKLLVVLAAVLTLVRSVFTALPGPAKYLAWLLPPLSEITERMAGRDSFVPETVLPAAVLMLVYGGVLYVLRTLILAKKKF